MGSARAQNEFSVMSNRNFYFIMLSIYSSTYRVRMILSNASQLIVWHLLQRQIHLDLVDKLTEILEKYEFSWQTDSEIHDPYDAPEAARALVSQIHDWSDEKGKWLSECDWKSFDSEDLANPPRNDVYLWPNFQFIVTDEKYIYHL